MTYDKMQVLSWHLCFLLICAIYEMLHKFGVFHSYLRCTSTQMVGSSANRFQACFALLRPLHGLDQASKYFPVVHPLL